MTYTATMVERLLRNYLDLRATIGGRGQQLTDVYVATKARASPRERPLGHQVGQTWPFMEPRHARPPLDGKARARQFEELHCAIIDLEAALARTHDDDLELLYKYFILQTHTLDALVAERQVTSRGSMRQRVWRAVERLAREMERGPTHE